MEKYISLREANQHLSQYVKELEEGYEITITRRGFPVARLLPVLTEKELSQEQQAARKRLRERMKKGYHLGGKMIDRDAIYAERTPHD